MSINELELLDTINAILKGKFVKGRMIGIQVLRDYKKLIRLEMSLGKRKIYKKIFDKGVPNKFCSFFYPKSAKDDVLYKKIVEKYEKKIQDNLHTIKEPGYALACFSSYEAISSL